MRAKLTDRDVAAVSALEIVSKLLQATARTADMRFAAVARVTDETWMACAVYDDLNFGLGVGDELALESTLCDDIRQKPRPIIFGHASEHPVYSTHHTPAMYAFESYVSIPIMTSDGEFWGTLCALDPEPKKLDEPHVVKTLELFADLIAQHLDTAMRLEVSERNLANEQAIAQVREEFIAVVSHDLRSPLTAATMTADLMAVDPRLDEHNRRRSENIKVSCWRMAEMIENILDLTRGRLGGGIPVGRKGRADLHDVLEAVVQEARTTFPGRSIDASIADVGLVQCDAPRLAQLTANLLSNALTHGDPSREVAATLRRDGDDIEIAVHNFGPAIAPEKIPLLFQPFSHDPQGAPRAGLGLGLYIANELSRAHDGELVVSSTDEEGTSFVFRMPCEPIDA
jgi:signal transduction histidine kinase